MLFSVLHVKQHLHINLSCKSMCMCQYGLKYFLVDITCWRMKINYVLEIIINNNAFVSSLMFKLIICTHFAMYSFLPFLYKCTFLFFICSLLVWIHCLDPDPVLFYFGCRELLYKIVCIFSIELTSFYSMWLDFCICLNDFPGLFACIYHSFASLFTLLFFRFSCDHWDRVHVYTTYLTNSVLLSF